ncbi:MAG: YbaY family lipoprotein [Planctomycetes bacterium]|nr:YbaY family lipoprotein [Planctomycetota bacterium]
MSEAAPRSRRSRQRCWPLLAAILLVSCENQPNPTPTSAPSSDRPLKQTIKEEAQKVAQTARESAREVAHAATQEAQVLYETTRENAREFGHAATQQAQELADSARTAVESFLRTSKEKTLAAAQRSIDAAKAQIEVLRERKAAVEEAMRPAYEQRMAELTEKYEELCRKADALRAAGPEVWREAGAALAPAVAEAEDKLSATWMSFVTGGVVKVSVRYSEKFILPEDAELTVTLLDLTRGEDKPGEVAKAVVKSAGPPPFCCELRFDPKAIDRKGAYALRATIAVDDKIQFVSRDSNFVLTQGRPHEIEVIVIRPK